MARPPSIWLDKSLGGHENRPTIGDVVAIISWSRCSLVRQRKEKTMAMSLLAAFTKRLKAICDSKGVTCGRWSGASPSSANVLVIGTKPDATLLYVKSGLILLGSGASPPIASPNSNARAGFGTQCSLWVLPKPATSRRSRRSGLESHLERGPSRGTPSSQGQRPHQTVGEGEFVQGAEEISKGFFERMRISGGHERESSVRVGETNGPVPQRQGRCTRVQ